MRTVFLLKVGAVAMIAPLRFGLQVHHGSTEYTEQDFLFHFSTSFLLIFFRVFCASVVKTS
jgi:hypothetical protein